MCVVGPSLHRVGTLLRNGSRALARSMGPVTGGEPLLSLRHASLCALPLPCRTSRAPRQRIARTAQETPEAARAMPEVPKAVEGAAAEEPRGDAGQVPDTEAVGAAKPRSADGEAKPQAEERAAAPAEAKPPQTAEEALEALGSGGRERSPPPRIESVCGGRGGVWAPRLADG